MIVKCGYILIDSHCVIQIIHAFSLLLVNPLVLTMDDMVTKVFFSSSPPQFCPSNRTVDIDAILYTIKTAKKFVKIAVMDYLTAVIYSQPKMYVLFCLL